MASDFKISIHRNSDNLHLKLLGDFDAYSAHQLVKTLAKYCTGAYSVFIHTNGLKHINPSGRNMLQEDLCALKNQYFGNLIFTGEYAFKIAPKNSYIL